MTLPELFYKLKKDPLKNIALLGFFENYPLKNYVTKGDTYILYGESDHLWAYISGAECDELRSLLKKAGQVTKYFASVEGWMKDIIEEIWEIEWEMNTMRYVFPQSAQIRQPLREIWKAKLSMAEYLYENSDYRFFTSIEYIRDRITNGISAVIIEDGDPVAWGLSHDDNSLGFLHVIPECRNKGYATDISSALIALRRQETKPVFVNVELSNVESATLVHKLGFLPDRKVSWVKVM